MGVTFPNRPTTTLPELQRDLRVALAELGPFVRARNVLGVDIATTETRVAHGNRGAAPAAFYVMQLGAGGPVYRSSPSDDTYLYLTSASGTVTCDVLVVP